MAAEPSARQPAAASAPGHPPTAAAGARSRAGRACRGRGRPRAGQRGLLKAGNAIPADVRFLETHALKVAESSLMSEAANVDKTAAVLPPGAYALDDRLDLGYRGARS